MRVGWQGVKRLAVNQIKPRSIRGLAESLIRSVYEVSIDSGSTGWMC